MTKSIQLVAASALLGLALSGSAQANFGPVPYAYAAVATVDNLDNPVDNLNLFGAPTSQVLAGNSWAQTEMGVHHVVAMGDGNPTLYGALSAWSDAFTMTGGSGFGVANVSLNVNGEFGAAAHSAAGYMLLKADEPVMPWDLMAYLKGGALPSGVETVMSVTADGVHHAGPVHGVLTGSFNYEYGTTFFLTSVFGAVASGAGAADFGNTALFGISTSGVIETGSGVAYMTAAVPEPKTWAMLLTGLGLIGLQAKRRRLGSKALAA